MRWILLDYPSYSPGVSPYDFYLFGSLKEALGGKRFEDDAGVEGFFAKLAPDTTSFFDDDGIKKLPFWWKKCIYKAGDYVEK